MVNKPIINDTISATTARRIYNRLGLIYDWAERFESHAKELALAWLELAPGQRDALRSAPADVRITAALSHSLRGLGCPRTKPFTIPASEQMM